MSGAELDRLREALEQIASGRYRATGGLTPEILARAALSPPTDSLRAAALQEAKRHEADLRELADAPTDSEGK